MEATHPTTLYLLCGKIAAGKSTLARQLVARPATLMIAMDDWMSVLYPTENQTLEDFTRLSARLRKAMGPHVAGILRQNLSVVLDFPANTVPWRAWMRSIIDAANVAHELHVLDLPDAICKSRLIKRNESGGHRYRVDEATYDLFMTYFVFPTADEGFNLIVHTS
jgi:predicted kinase